MSQSLLRLKKIWSSLKPYLRWVIVGATLFFLAKVLKDHLAEVATITINLAGWIKLALALAVTLAAHTWAGWVWSTILREFNQPVNRSWAIKVYLKTNLAKYLPGNVWHYYGRISAVTEAGVALNAATLSVLLEPLLMMTAALIITLSGSFPTFGRGWQVLSLAVVCLGIHPRFLNSLMQLLSRFKGKATNTGVFQIKHYLLLPLLGELGFLGLRGTGFLLALLALTQVNLSQIPQLLSTFSLAWLLGLVVPGAPGGIGVFEATITVLLDKQFSPGLLLSVVALFRVVSIVAEVIAALVASLLLTPDS